LIYVIADLHFNHQNIISYENRPFKDVPHMNRALIDNWNGVVNKEDTVYVLGDFGFNGNKSLPDCDLVKIFNELNGEKHLLLGNHDRRCRQVLALPWASQNQVFGITVEEQRYFMSHYPHEAWKYQDSNEGQSIHLHGHIHSNRYMTSIPNRFCVSVEVIDYTPIDIRNFAMYKQIAGKRHVR
jgi:calcineurin-like phosphoesterase family protein